MKPTVHDTLTAIRDSLAAMSARLDSLHQQVGQETEVIEWAAWFTRENLLRTPYGRYRAGVLIKPDGYVYLLDLA